MSNKLKAFCLCPSSQNWVGQRSDEISVLLGDVAGQDATYLYLENARYTYCALTDIRNYAAVYKLVRDEPSIPRLRATRALMETYFDDGQIITKFDAPVIEPPTTPVYAPGRYLFFGLVLTTPHAVTLREETTPGPVYLVDVLQDEGSVLRVRVLGELVGQKWYAPDHTRTLIHKSDIVAHARAAADYWPTSYFLEEEARSPPTKQPRRTRKKAT